MPNKIQTTAEGRKNIRESIANGLCDLEQAGTFVPILLDDVDAALSQLKELEWSGFIKADGQLHIGYCPCCYGANPKGAPDRPVDTVGHTRTCTLAEMIKNN